MTLWTITYGGVSWETFVQALKDAGVQLVLDVRRTAWSESSPCYREAELLRELPRAGLEYQRAKELGNWVQAECLVAGNVGPYAKYLDERPELVDRLLLRLAAGERLALLCGCPNPQACHRGVIAAAAERRRVEVRHLRPRQGQDSGPPPKILGISTHQPWTWAITEGHTRLINVLEAPNRACSYLAIHANKEYDGALHLQMNRRGCATPPKMRQHHQHGVVAVGKLGGLLRERETPTGADPWWWGPVGLVLEELVLIEPVPCRGAAGLWRLPPEALALVRSRWKAARAAQAATEGK